MQTKSNTTLRFKRKSAISPQSPEMQSFSGREEFCEECVVKLQVRVDERPWRERVFRFQTDIPKHDKYY